MTVPWWHDAVIYQIYPRSFQDSNRDGIGDLAGIRRRLGYLTDLGVDAIWISPFYPSPMADFGYDIADYCDVDPQFGTLDDFDALVTDAHGMGLRVIIDWVPNHTSDRHPWFLASRSSRPDPKRDWYVWRDPKPDGSPPNNWVSVFGGPAWTFDEATGQYYLHSFLPEQPDLNWRNPEVEAAMLDTLRFWLARGVDGFRIDVAHRVMKHPDLLDNQVSPGGGLMGKDMGEWGNFLHVHDLGHPDVHGVFRKIRSVLDEFSAPGRERIAIGEIHDPDWERWTSYYGKDLDELHMPFDFSLLFADWSATAFRERVEAQERVLPPGAWPNHVLGNHDEVRIASRFGDRRMPVAATMLLTLRGTPTLYYGDELGMLQADIPDERQQDPWGRRVPGHGRDGCRTPMQWDSSPHAGFCDPDVAPWLPVGPEADRRNVAVASQDPASLWSCYHALLRLRREHEALRRGSYRSLDTHEAVFGFVRETDEERLETYLNFADEPAPIDTAGEVVFATTPRRVGSRISAPTTLAPNEGIVVRPEA